MSALGRRGEVHDEALRTQVAPELLAEQCLDVGLVVYHKNQDGHVGPLASILFGKIICPRQYDPEFGKLPGLCFHVNPATMLFHDDVVAH